MKMMQGESFSALREAECLTRASAESGKLLLKARFPMQPETQRPLLSPPLAQAKLSCSWRTVKQNAARNRPPTG
jgi:hypothetical protein